MKKEYDFSRGKRGPAISTQGMTRITIYLHDNILAAFKVESARIGTGYQTLINEALALHILNTERTITVDTHEGKADLRHDMSTLICSPGDDDSCTRKLFTEE